MIYVARRPFVNEGHQYLPGDIVSNVDSWPRSESALRAGFIVLKEIQDVAPTRRLPEPEPEPVKAPVKRATRKPKE